MTHTATLLFDLDGTLTDNYAGISRSIVHALTTLRTAVPDEDVLRSCVEPPLRKSFARLLQTEDAARVERENDVYAGIGQALDALATRGHRMILCTSKPRVYAQRIVDHFGIAGWIGTVYGPELDGRFDNKNDLLGAIIAAERLDANACLMIGDREQDMIAARANGVDGIGVLWGYGSSAELISAGARRLVARPAELPDAL